MAPISWNCCNMSKCISNLRMLGKACQFHRPTTLTESHQKSKILDTLNTCPPFSFAHLFSAWSSAGKKCASSHWSLSIVIGWTRRCIFYISYITYIIYQISNIKYHVSYCIFISLYIYTYIHIVFQIVNIIYTIYCVLSCFTYCIVILYFIFEIGYFTYHIIYSLCLLNFKYYTMHITYHT